LGGCEPARDQSGIVGGTDENAIAWLYSEVLDQCPGDPIGPVGKLFIGTPAAVADQRDMIAEAARHHAVCQLDCGVELLGIFEATKQNIRPFLRRRKIVPGESVDMARAAERRLSHDPLPRASAAQ